VASGRRLRRGRGGCPGGHRRAPRGVRNEAPPKIAGATARSASHDRSWSMRRARANKVSRVVTRPRASRRAPQRSRSPRSHSCRRSARVATSAASVVGPGVCLAGTSLCGLPHGRSTTTGVPRPQSAEGRTPRPQTTWCGPVPPRRTPGPATDAAPLATSAFPTSPRQATPLRREAAADAAQHRCAARRPVRGFSIASPKHDGSQP